ncbi:Kae1-associated kinase Bud32 [Thermogladius sp. 4427co]|uniref:Kae1-associated kinase Bud32 n=1 Tax=Thermogladius sp. 4427co TaxID=3450718 RepID=UPI003F7AE14C
MDEVTEFAEGAESKIMKGKIGGINVVFKIRVSRKYRHPDYDRVFRESRTRNEVKIMLDLLEKGVRIPIPIAVDLNNYIIVMTVVEGRRLSEIILEEDVDLLAKTYFEIGRQVGVIHNSGIYHGDLTISNIIVDSRLEPYIIDFGLSGYSNDIEEYAIDLHLFDRSTRNTVPEKASVLMNSFLTGYSSVFPKYRDVLERMADIRRRGRYVEERLRKRLRRDAYTA